MNEEINPFPFLRNKPFADAHDLLNQTRRIIYGNFEPGESRKQALAALNFCELALARCRKRRFTK